MDGMKLAELRYKAIEWCKKNEIDLVIKTHFAEEQFVEAEERYEYGDALGTTVHALRGAAAMIASFDTVEKIVARFDFVAKKTGHVFVLNDKDALLESVEDYLEMSEQIDGELKPKDAQERLDTENQVMRGILYKRTNIQKAVDEMAHKAGDEIEKVLSGHDCNHCSEEDRQHCDLYNSGFMPIFKAVDDKIRAEIEKDIQAIMDIIAKYPVTDHPIKLISTRARHDLPGKYSLTILTAVLTFTTHEFALDELKAIREIVRHDYELMGAKFFREETQKANISTAKLAELALDKLVKTIGKAVEKKEEEHREEQKGFRKLEEHDVKDIRFGNN